MRFPHSVFALLIAMVVCAPCAFGQGDGGSDGGEGHSEAWESQKIVTFDFGDSHIRLLNQHQLFSFATGADSDWSVSDQNQEPIEITEPITTGTVDVAVSPFEATASAVAQWAIVTDEFEGSAELVNSVGGTATIADKYNPALVAVSWGSHTSAVELGEETSQGVIDWTPVISVGTGGGAYVSAYDQISIDDPLVVRTRNDLGELSDPIKVFEFSARFNSDTQFRWNQLRDILGGVDGPQVIVNPDDGPFLDAGSRGTGNFSLSFQSELIPIAERGTISVAFEDGIVTNAEATGVFSDIAPAPGPVEAGDSRLPTVGGVAVIDRLLPVVEGAPTLDSDQRFRLQLDAGAEQAIHDAAACSDGVQVSVGPAVDIVQTFTINPLQRTDPLANIDGGVALGGETSDLNGPSIGQACLGEIREDADLLFGTDYVSRGDVSMFHIPGSSPIDRVLRLQSTPESPRQAAFFATGAYDSEENSDAIVHRWTARFDVRSAHRKKNDTPVVLPPIDVAPVEPIDPDTRLPDTDVRQNPQIIESVNVTPSGRPRTVVPVSEDLNSPRFVFRLLENGRLRAQTLPGDTEQTELFKEKVEGLLLTVIEDDVPIAKLTLNGQVLGESVMDPDLIKPNEDGWRHFELEMTQTSKGVKVAINAVNQRQQKLAPVFERVVPDMELSQLGYQLAVGGTSGVSTDENATATVIHDFDNLLTAYQNLGDVAWDGRIDGDDFLRMENAWELKSQDPLFDLNFDGAVDIIDLETIEDMIPNKVPGDTNFDGHVRFEDFLRLSRNYGEETGLWSRGDFDSNGKVGFLDFLTLSRNFERTAAEGDPVDAVPEPQATSLMALVIGGLSLLRTRSRRNIQGN